MSVPCTGPVLSPTGTGFVCWCVYCLFGVLRRFQHCTGHITTGSWKGRGNQYIEFARVVYCKLPTNGKHDGHDGDRSPAAEVGGESVTTLPPWPPSVGVMCQ